MWVPGVLLQSLKSYARSLIQVSRTQLCSSTIENVLRSIWLANGSFLDEASGKKCRVFVLLIYQLAGGECNCSHNDPLEHFEINVSPAYHGNHFFALEFFFVLKDSANSKDSRPFRHQAMLLKQ